MIAPTEWVESLGGPLIVVPVSALNSWTGSVGDDYDRACQVDGFAGAIPVGGAQGLVLADDPATTCYLPEYHAFLRWLAADSEADLVAAAEAALADPATEWEDCGTWETDGPAVLFDSAVSGADLASGWPAGGHPDQASVAIAAGRWQVRVLYREGESTWFELVHLTKVAS
ncbi:immunity 21 family protein [Kibdelosporangium philippinense]|uniref:Immunity 21 family protein n=1 Tax=Kibdelosporangium philippinense TaxID=211113 RepID=A0ABS8Z1I0_9PSEU|nr:Imm21 family immunity protein [Kibdelosporangium philippinense]MCE7001784.1 immunity 21 family protein [Kibdelosporangium philippinense]